MSAPMTTAFMESATPAATVSNQFVSQFYTVLHTSPRHLHRFYSEASTLTLADARPDGQHIVKTVTGQKSIHEAVMNQGLEDTVTEVYSVDSQYSLNGGVVVQVTGTQSNKGGPMRPFVQTFFLAVQEKGFYVMNDMFRFLPDYRLVTENGYPSAPAGVGQQVPKANGVAVPPGPAPPAVVPPVPAAPPMMPPAMPALLPPVAVPAPQPLPPPPMPMPLPPAVPPAAVAVMPLPAAAALVPPPQQQQQQPSVAQPAQPQPVAAVQQQPAAEQQQQQQVPPPSAAAPAQRPSAAEPPKTEPKPAEPAVPLSYAERLKQGRSSSMPSSPTKQPASGAAAAFRGPAEPAAAPAVPAPAPAAAAPPAAAPAGTAAAPAPAGGDMPRSASQSGSEQGGGFGAEQGAPVSSVFMREIPASVTIEELVAKLSSFGPLRPGGVQLKTQRGKDSYAFVDFETPEAAQACMEAGLDFEGGHHVNVVEKRPLIIRPGMRGRGGPPTGYSGRGDRGAYRGGRGGRGPYPGVPMMMDGGRGMGGRGMGGPPMGAPMRGRGDGRPRYDDRGRGRGPRPPMPVV